jgi:hypothetical protein
MRLLHDKLNFEVVDQARTAQSRRGEHHQPGFTGGR